MTKGRSEAVSQLLCFAYFRLITDARGQAGDHQMAQCEHNLLTRRPKAIYRHSAVMLMVEPVSGRIVDANPAACAFYGYGREEMQSLLIHDINTLPVPEAEACRLKFFAGARKNFTLPHRRKDGSIRMADVYSCLIPDGDGLLLYSIYLTLCAGNPTGKSCFMKKRCF